MEQQQFQFAHLGEYLWPGIVQSCAWTLDAYSFCFVFVGVFCIMLCFLFSLFPLAMPTCKIFVCTYVVACV